MFTGIIQATGTVRSIQRGSTSTHLMLDAPDLPRPITDGASVCVNGVCLTVTKSDPTSLEFDVVPETLSRSTLGSLSVADRVNLEPSLRAGDPLDGHMVQGHIDGIAEVRDIRTGSGGHIYTFAADGSLMPFMIPKGSVAIDGVSLTLADVGENTFSIALIPTTLAETTFGSLKVSDRVNVETDIVARTIVATMQRLQASHKGHALTMETLKEHGFL